MLIALLRSKFSQDSQFLCCERTCVVHSQEATSACMLLQTDTASHTRQQHTNVQIVETYAVALHQQVKTLTLSTVVTASESSIQANRGLSRSMKSFLLMTTT